MESKGVSEEQVYKGRLGRTSKTSVLISSHAGPVFPASVYTGVNVTEDPELREKLFDGELNRVPSPFSERTYDLAIPVRYHDEELRLFVLVIPESLRHEEFKHRSELLNEMAREREVLPDYVKNFRTVFDAEALATLEQSQLAALTAPAADAGEEASDEAGPNEVTVLSKSPLPAPPAVDTAALEEERADIKRERDHLEKKREELSLKETQLGDVSERLERERERMEEVEMNIATEREEIDRDRQRLILEREEIERERQQLEATRLNLEQRELEAAQGGAIVAAEEKTQVVTDDQFIEVVEDDPVDLVLDEKEILEEHDVVTSAPSTGLLSETALPADTPDDEFGPDDATHITQVPGLNAVHVSSTFDETYASGQDYYTRVVDGYVVAAWRTGKKAVDRVLDNDPKLFIQYAVIEECPLATILLASLDDGHKLSESFGWPLDVTHDNDRAVIDALMAESAVRFAFYDRKGKLIRSYDAKADLEANVRWIKEKADDFLADASGAAGVFGTATEVFFSDDYERLGSMRHNFYKSSFEDLRAPSEIKLAAGIVGYWSSGDVFDYLIGNRSFPLCLKPNDLDPIEQWENWDALLEFADESGVQPDPDVVELAQAALRRAQEFQQQEEELPGERTQITQIPTEAKAKGGEGDEKLPANMPKLPGPPAFNLSDENDGLVVARRSETTGVTYFLPDDDVLDSFDDMSTMSKDDLLLLLEDANGRLEAAQMLIERFGAPVVSRVLEGSEEMMAGEVASLAKFLETRADGLEGELVRCIESGGPSATYIASHALVQVKSTSAIPTLLDALRDPKRQGNLEVLATTLAGYGDKLVPALTRTIKSKGHDDAVVALLRRLGQRDEELLNNLAKDRNRRIREAAKAARS
ncbi:unnamed protein product [Ostreobium quekettii]|uniref:CpXC domain-containing protein n=1 Tax=Ostreobium quekettii TaxID=121088 RepID=A0A8S1IL45_9CHLO|nr:unnamed protein product [Ostreobium quekettii]